jgi:hypothetical protein
VQEEPFRLGAEAELGKIELDRALQEPEHLGAGADWFAPAPARESMPFLGAQHPGSLKLAIRVCQPAGEEAWPAAV